MSRSIALLLFSIAFDKLRAQREAPAVNRGLSLTLTLGREGVIAVRPCFPYLTVGAVYHQLGLLVHRNLPATLYRVGLSGKEASGPLSTIALESPYVTSRDHTLTRLTHDDTSFEMSPRRAAEACPKRHKLASTVLDPRGKRQYNTNALVASWESPPRRRLSFS